MRLYCLFSFSDVDSCVLHRLHNSGNPHIKFCNVKWWGVRVGGYLAVDMAQPTTGLDVSVISQHHSIYIDLNSTEDRRLCRSLCSLFWACSLFCWEILFQEPNGIWHQKPIFSSSHLAVGSVGSTTANDNTSFYDKLFLIFIISSLLKYLSIFFPFKKELHLN